MDITPYGYKKPSSPDTGEVFWPALEFDILRLDAHSHNGVDSVALVTNSVLVTTQAISSASWGSDLGGGTYRQEITLPSVGNGGPLGVAVQLTFDAIALEIRTTAGEKVYPKIVKSAASKYYIYTNDNTQAFTAVYTS